MGRLLVLVMASAFLAAPSPVAVAAEGTETRVVIRVADPVVSEGEPVEVSGRVVGTRLGTRVLLQRREAAGAWKTVKERRLRETRRYAFTLRPPRGAHQVRVVKPRQSGRPRTVSDVVDVHVQWAPVLTAVAESANDGTGGQVLTVTGAVSHGPATPALRLERYDGTTWLPVAEQALESADADYAFEETVAPGSQFRVRLAGTALTTEQTSATFGHAHTPYLAEMNSEKRYLIRGGEGVEVIEFDAEEGALVTLAPEGPDQVTGAYGPSGELVAAKPTYPERLMRFTAAETGRYRLEVKRVGFDYEFGLAVSVPKVVETTMETAVTVASDVEGQPIDVRFDATGIRAFTVPMGVSTGETVSLLDADGEAVEEWLPAGTLQGREPVYRPGDGTYTLRMVPSRRVLAAYVHPMAVHWVPAEVNGPIVRATVDEVDRVVLVEYDRPAEQVTVAHRTAEDTPHEEVATFDAVTGAPHPTGEGRSVTAVSAHSWHLLSVDVQLTTPVHHDVALDGEALEVGFTDNIRRLVALHFTVTAGQALTLESVSEDPQGLGPHALQAPGGTSLATYGYFLPGGVWSAPEDGEYVMFVVARGDASRETTGSVRLRTLTTVELTGDGTPVTVNIDEPDELIVGVVPMPGGSVVDATVDNLSEDLSPDRETRNWEVALYNRANAYWFNTWAIPGTLPVFVVPQPGDIVAVISAEVPGSLRLRFDPRE